MSWCEESLSRTERSYSIVLRAHHSPKMAIFIIKQVHFSRGGATTESGELVLRCSVYLCDYMRCIELRWLRQVPKVVRANELVVDVSDGAGN